MSTSVKSSQKSETKKNNAIGIIGTTCQWAVSSGQWQARGLAAIKSQDLFLQGDWKTIYGLRSTLPLLVCRDLPHHPHPTHPINEYEYPQSHANTLLLPVTVVSHSLTDYVLLTLPTLYTLPYTLRPSNNKNLSLVYSVTRAKFRSKYMLLRITTTHQINAPATYHHSYQVISLILCPEKENPGGRLSHSMHTCSYTRVPTYLGSV